MRRNTMSKRFLISVAAAALIAGTGFANAQNPGGAGKESPAAGGGAAMQHNAPAGGASSGAMQRDTGGMKGSEHATTGQSSGMKGAESDKAAPATKGAQDNMQKPKSMSSENEGARDKTGAKDMKAEGRDKSGNMNAEKSNTTSPTNQNAQTRTPADTNRAQTNERSQTTTGNAATSATAAPPAEKRSQISTAIRSEKVTEVTNVNFNVSVGTRVPADVHFYPVPEQVVTIYPEWRGYEFILVGGRYIIVQPETHEIVYIIEG
jgi:Protein of unknown function (DUF1236)